MKNYLNFSKLLWLSCVLVLSLGCSNDNTEPSEDLLQTALKANLGDKFNFTTSLKGSNEEPAAITNAAGHVSVKISKDEQSIHYKITAANIDNVRASHFHMAPSGVNGPVVVTLYSNPVQPSGPQNGVLAEGVVTAANVTGVLVGDLESLIAAIRTGNIYVNVHTSNFPGGELRGQLAD